MIYILWLFLITSCSLHRPVFQNVSSKNIRVIEFEPAIDGGGDNRYQFEDEDRYYAFTLSKKEQTEAEELLKIISTSPDQQVVIKYSKYYDTTCFKSLRINDQILEIPSLTTRCDLYVSKNKEQPGLHYLAIAPNPIGKNQVSYFLKKNKKFNSFKNNIENSSIQVEMPERVLYFIWGTPIVRHSPDENQVILLEYSHWYVSLKGGKIFSFSAKNLVLDTEE